MRLLSHRPCATEGCALTQPATAQPSVRVRKVVIGLPNLKTAGGLFAEMIQRTAGGPSDSMVSSGGPLLERTLASSGGPGFQFHWSLSSRRPVDQAFILMVVSSLRSVDQVFDFIALHCLCSSGTSGGPSFRSLGASGGPSYLSLYRDIKESDGKKDGAKVWRDSGLVDARAWYPGGGWIRGPQVVNAEGIVTRKPQGFMEMMWWDRGVKGHGRM